MPLNLFPLQNSEDIFNFGRVPGAQLDQRNSIVGLAHRLRRSAREEIAIDRRIAGLVLHLEPFPGIVDSKEIAGEVLGGLARLAGGGMRIILERLLSVRAKALFEALDEILSRGRRRFGI